MVEIINQHIVDGLDADQKYYTEVACLSTDAKPTDGLATGSIAVEADTGTVFFFNGTSWVEQFSFQG